MSSSQEKAGRVLAFTAAAMPSTFVGKRPGVEFVSHDVVEMFEVLTGGEKLLVKDSASPGDLALEEGATAELQGDFESRLSAYAKFNFAALVSDRGARCGWGVCELPECRSRNERLEVTLPRKAPRRVPRSLAPARRTCALSLGP